jgi:hypothetical protein
MGKSWVNNDAFDKFVEQKKQEKEPVNTGGFKRKMEMMWKNPVRGTTEKAKVYTGRFLVDPKGQYYKKYHFHAFMLGDKFQSHLCPKTFNFDNFCPWCSATMKLYSGTTADKKSAKNYKRKDKYLSNFYIVDDPRDHENDDKVNGSVKIYEFPMKLEAKVKEQVTDKKNGLGAAIFDPGEDGFDLLIKILSTKKDQFGKEWPDYSLSDFSRKSYALGTDEEIETIMKSTIDLDEYLELMERDDEFTVEALKQAMLWDLIKDDWNNAKNIKTVTPKPTEKVDDDDDDDIPEPKAEKTKVEPEGDELSDDQLLKELESL